ncbi:MAG: outer membrane beta-barrel protein [Nitrospinaceae bacterium]|nr:porin family protein [Nitrospinaceae bacterium]NIR55878.1 porin family protein [Nitrospinaceae bacterium]NIS86330.1 porin family protein [Nitrospinaceae bacterium]NIT83160.1 porin family protein [Nitrospinaceae bacterium]NIU45369.1 porin family protein [Nitrospinaceae bacterium]
MKRTVLAVLMLSMALAVNTPSANAQDGMYGSVNLGFSFFNEMGIDFGPVERGVDFGIGSVVSFALGTPLNENVRVEGEITFRQASVDTFAGFDGEGLAGAVSFMGNGYYDIPLEGSPIKPFVGAGLGFGLLYAAGTGPVGGASTSDSGVGFNYQIMGGGAYEVQSDLFVTATLRYWGSTGVTLEDENGTVFDVNSIGATELYFGVRKLF